MTVDTTGFQRARSAANKEARRESILEAARALAEAKGIPNVTLTDIAGRVGMHKSAVLRYFETREAIFLHLTQDEWHHWLGTIREHLAADSGPVGSAAEDLAGILVSSLAARPLFCDLLGRAPLNLECNVSTEVVRRYKLAAMQVVADVADIARAMVPALDEDQAWELIVAVTSLTAVIWQIANPPESVQALYRRDPAFGHTRGEFVPRLTMLTLALIRGLTVGPEAGT